MSGSSDPPVVVISGDDDFQLRRFLKWFMKEMAEDGRTVQRTEGKRIGETLAALSSVNLTGRKTLIVVDNPHQFDLSIIESHHKSKDSTAVLALYYEGKVKGNTKFGKLVKKLKRHHKEHLKPKIWDADKVAIAFCMEESKNLGKLMTEDLAKAFVAVVGNDLGFLSFEILKAVRLAEFEKADSLTFDHVKRTKAALHEAEVFPILRALEDRRVDHLMRNLDQLRTTSKRDPTIRVCRMMQSMVFRWLTVTNLSQKGLSPNGIASQLGINPWYFRNKVFPSAQRWGEKGAIRLVKVLAASERSVLSGHVDPWIGFTARLIEACQERNS